MTGPDRNLTVSRKNIWSSSLPYLKREHFWNATGDLNVTFGVDEAAEDAEDLGGPKREYFRLLLKALVQDSGLLLGKNTTV